MTRAMGPPRCLSIHQWLANVSPSDLKDCTRDIHDSGRINDSVSNERSQLPRSGSATSRDILTHTRLQRGQAKGLSDDLCDELDHSDRADRKGVKGYDRNPRHKTREKRHEYHKNGPASGRIRGTKKVQRIKTSRRSRRQTMNEGFRASNVARARLTLPLLASVGIFSKGKSSSPIQLRHGQYQDSNDEKRPVHPREFPSLVPGLEFSETTFAVRNNQISPKASTSNKVTPGQPGVNHHKCGKKSIDCSPGNESSKQDIKQAKVGSIKSISAFNEARTIIGMPKEQQDSSGHSMFFPGVKSTSHCTREWNPQANQQDASPASPSTTPYTWSVTQPHRSRTSRSIEDSLLAVLRGNLLVGDDVQSKAVDISKHYYELKDLQELLEARKATWEERSNGVYPVPCSPSFFIPQSASKSSSEKWADTPELKEVTGQGLNNDLELFEQLDVLLQDIVSSQGRKPISEGKQLEIPSHRPRSLHTPEGYSGSFRTQNKTAVCCDHIHMPPCNRIGRDNDTSASLGETLPDARAKICLRQRSNCKRECLPVLFSNTLTKGGPVVQTSRFLDEGSQRSFSNLIPNVQPITDQQQSIPPNFWRRNKLY